MRIAPAIAIPVRAHEGRQPESKRGSGHFLTPNTGALPKLRLKELIGLTTPPRTKLDRARRVRVVEVAGSRLWGLLGVSSKSLPMLSEPGPVALQPLT